MEPQIFIPQEWAALAETWQISHELWGRLLVAIRDFLTQNPENASGQSVPLISYPDGKHVDRHESTITLNEGNLSHIFRFVYTTNPLRLQTLLHTWCGPSEDLEINPDDILGDVFGTDT